MRPVTSAAIALLATGLISCSPDPQTKITEACTGFDQDLEAVEAITGVGTDIAGFCDCLATEFTALPEAEQAGLPAALEAVTSELEYANTDAVVDAIEEAGEAADATQAEQDLSANVERVGELVENTFDKIAQNDGACATAG